MNIDAPTRAEWLHLAMTFATRPLVAREQLADHLDALGDDYLAGLADALRIVGGRNTERKVVISWVN